MTPSSSDLSEQVWQRTLPALRRRRLTRRAAITGGAAVLIVSLVTALLPPRDVPASYQWSWSRPPTEQPAEQPSLAVLVVDQAGTHFQQLHPDQIVGEGLRFELTLEPVITGGIPEVY